MKNFIPTPPAKKPHARPRVRIHKEDLQAGTLVHKPGVPGAPVLTLGEPKLKNVNMNVVYHCQLYLNGELQADTWYNVTTLYKAGYRLAQPAA